MTQNIQLLKNEFFYQGFNVHFTLFAPHKEWLEAQIQSAKYSSDFIRFIVRHFKLHIQMNKIQDYGILYLNQNYWVIDEVFFNHCIQKHNQYAHYVAQFIHTHQYVELPILRQYHEFHK